jgi:hypothetical protein
MSDDPDNPEDQVQSDQMEHESDGKYSEQERDHVPRNNPKPHAQERYSRAPRRESGQHRDPERDIDREVGRGYARPPSRNYDADHEYQPSEHNRDSHRRRDTDYHSEREQDTARDTHSYRDSGSDYSRRGIGNRDPKQAAADFHRDEPDTHHHEYNREQESVYQRSGNYHRGSERGGYYRDSQPQKKRYSRDIEPPYPKEGEHYLPDEDNYYAKEKEIHTPYTRERTAELSTTPSAYSRDFQHNYPWQSDPETEGAYNWKHQDEKRNSQRYSRLSRDRDSAWERYADVDQDISPRNVIPETYRCLPQRPQSFVATDLPESSLPRRKLPQIPVREAGRPSSYIHMSRFKSYDDDRNQGGQNIQQYHSNPHLSVGGPLPTHYESYYHELRLGNAKTSPHSSLRQLPPTPLESSAGHRRTNSSGGITTEPAGEKDNPRLSYQEDRRSNAYASQTSHNFSSLPRDHRLISRPRSDFYNRNYSYRDHTTTSGPKRTSYTDDTFTHLSGLPDTYTHDTEEMYASRRGAHFDDPLDPKSQYDYIKSSQSRHIDYPIEDIVANPDYYELEAKYTQADPLAFEKRSQGQHYRDYPGQRYQRPGAPSSYREDYKVPRDHYHREFRDQVDNLDPVSSDHAERDRDPDYGEQQHRHDAHKYRDPQDSIEYRESREPRDPPKDDDRERGHVKHQLSWEKYSDGDQSEDLRYVVAEPEKSTGARSRHHVRPKEDPGSTGEPKRMKSSPSKKRTVSIRQFT